MGVGCALGLGSFGGLWAAEMDGLAGGRMGLVGVGRWEAQLVWTGASTLSLITESKKKEREKGNKGKRLVKGLGQRVFSQTHKNELGPRKIGVDAFARITFKVI